MNIKIETIKSDTDCRDEIARFIGDPIQTKRDYSVWACPFHSEKSTGAFHVWADGYHCFSCDAHGDIFDLWEFFTNRTLKELLAEHSDIDPEEANARRAEIQARAALARQKVDEERARQLVKLHASERHILYNDNLRNSQQARVLWAQRGISQDWQSFFELGYSENFSYMGKSGKLTTSTLVIPIKKTGGGVVTIRHRLLNSIDGSRYRPEVSGLGSHPFICDTSMPQSDNLIIVEGEIKAMVVYLTYDKIGAQVVGIPSKSMMVDTIRRQQGRRGVTIIPDPDGIADVENIARSVGAKVLRLPDKVDDLIVRHGLDKHWIRNGINQARIV